MHSSLISVSGSRRIPPTSVLCRNPRMGGRQGSARTSDSQCPCSPDVESKAHSLSLPVQRYPVLFTIWEDAAIPRGGQGDFMSTVPWSCPVFCDMWCESPLPHGEKVWSASQWSAGCTGLGSVPRNVTVPVVPPNVLAA